MYNLFKKTYLKSYSYIIQLIAELIQIFFPNQCLYCHVIICFEEILCAQCASLVPPILSSWIKLSNKYTMVVHAAGDYTNALKFLILSKLWSNKLSGKQIARIIWKNSQLSNIDFDYLIPIPLHWTRYYWRGYNQAEIICQELSVLSGKPYINIIKRNKRTLMQSLFKSSQRSDNLKNAFILKESDINIENKVVIIVDDLMTTGITLIEAGKTISSLNPKAILAAVGARVLK